MTHMSVPFFLIAIGYDGVRLYDIYVHGVGFSFCPRIVVRWMVGIFLIVLTEILRINLGLSTESLQFLQ